MRINNAMEFYNALVLINGGKLSQGQLARQLRAIIPTIHHDPRYENFKGWARDLVKTIIAGGKTNPTVGQYSTQRKRLEAALDVAYQYHLVYKIKSLEIHPESTNHTKIAISGLVSLMHVRGNLSEHDPLRKKVNGDIRRMTDALSLPLPLHGE